MSFLTGSNVELIYQNIVAGAAKASFTSEFQINDTATMGAQAVLPPWFFMPMPGGVAKSLLVKAVGILSCTATPTYQWSLRLGAAGTTAAIVLGTAALTCQSGITNKQWLLEGIVTMRTLGAAGANSTVFGSGYVESMGGLASPFGGELWGGAAQPGTVATVDISIANFLSFNITCSASSASNSIQLLSLSLFGLN